MSFQVIAPVVAIGAAIVLLGDGFGRNSMIAYSNAEETVLRSLHSGERFTVADRTKETYVCLTYHGFTRFDDKMLEVFADTQQGKSSMLVLDGSERIVLFNDCDFK